MFEQPRPNFQQPLTLASGVLDLSWTAYGLGKPMVEVSLPDLQKGSKVLWSLFWLYHIQLWLSKLSALAFYARIFGSGNKTFRLALWAVTGLICTWIVAVLVSLILQCNPPQQAWERTNRDACHDPYNWLLASGVSDLILDLIILLLPLPMIWRLRVKQSRKALIIGVFISGYS